MATPKVYKTKEELIEALKKSLNLRNEFESRARARMAEMRAAGLIE